MNNRDLAAEYEKRFDNLDEVADLSIAFDPRFGQLMQRAIDRSEPLTRAQVEAVFGSISWDW